MLPVLATESYYTEPCNILANPLVAINILGNFFAVIYTLVMRFRMHVGL